MKSKKQKIKLEVPCPHKTIWFGMCQSTKQRIKPIQCFEEAHGNTCTAINDLNCILFAFTRQPCHIKCSPVTVPSTAYVQDIYQNAMGSTNAKVQNTEAQSIKIDINNDKELNNEIQHNKQQNQEEYTSHLGTPDAKSPSKQIQRLESDDPFFNLRFRPPIIPSRGYIALSHQVCYILTRLRLKKSQLQSICRYFSVQATEQSQLLEYLVDMFQVPDYVFSIYKYEDSIPISFEFLLILMKKLNAAVNFTLQTAF